MSSLSLWPVALFGLIGVFARYFLDLLFGKWFSVFPVGILSINILGSALAGFIYVMGTERGALSPQLSLGLLVGFCGGFTTFSTYALQSFLLLEKGNIAEGLAYLLVSPLLGLGGAFIGVSLARAWA